MRFLANENIPGAAVAALRESGHDVAWIRTDAPGSSDEEVLARAVNEERIILTFDKDFGELAYRSQLPSTCGIILIRASVSSPKYAANLLLNALDTYTEWEGHFSVLEKNRVRIRPLPGR